MHSEVDLTRTGLLLARNILGLLVDILPMVRTQMILPSSIKATATSYWWSAHGGYSASEHYYNPDSALFIQLFAGYWGEPIEIDGQQGMRFWSDYRHVLHSDPDRREVINGNLYQECKYTSGQPFRPSGQAGQPPTRSGWTDFAIPLLTAGPPVEEMPEITHLQTNETISLQSFSWNIADDLLFKTILCESKEWNGNHYETRGSGPDSFVFMPPLPGLDTGHVYYNFDQRLAEERVHEWSVVNGDMVFDTAFSLFPGDSGWFERRFQEETPNRPEYVFDINPIRIWRSSTEYADCSLRAEFGDTLLPTGAVSLITADIDSELSQSDVLLPVDQNNDDANISGVAQAGNDSIDSEVSQSNDS